MILPFGFPAGPFPPHILVICCGRMSFPNVLETMLSDPHSVFAPGVTDALNEVVKQGGHVPLSDEEGYALQRIRSSLEKMVEFDTMGVLPPLPPGRTG
jgi:hypothetical protein